MAQRRPLCAQAPPIGIQLFHQATRAFPLGVTLAVVSAGGYQDLVPCASHRRLPPRPQEKLRGSSEKGTKRELLLVCVVFSYVVSYRDPGAILVPSWRQNPPSTQPS